MLYEPLGNFWPKCLMSFRADRQTDVASMDLLLFDLAGTDVRDQTEGRFRPDQVIECCRQQQQWTLDPFQVDDLLSQAKFAFDQLIALVQALDEFAKGFTGNGNVVVGPFFHREVVFQESIAVHVLAEVDVLFDEVLDGLHHLKGRLQEGRRTIAVRINQPVDIEVLFFGPQVQQRLVAAEVDWRGHQVQGS